ncbi:MAG: hypothetical protein IPK83_13640 [Planctomycetes bacterium]|nr:hypothetical protein [Planctomycetota bacterium]
MDTGAVVAVTLQPANRGDTTSIAHTIDQVDENLVSVMKDEAACEELSEQVLAEAVADKGYHSNDVLKDYRELDIRTYISEPDRGPRNWQGKTEEETAEKLEARDAVCQSSPDQGRAGKSLMRKRGNWSSGVLRTAMTPAACVART